MGLLMFTTSKLDKDKMLLLDFVIQTHIQLLYEETCCEGEKYFDRTVMLDCCIRSKLDMQFSASIKEVLCWRKCVLPLAHPQHLNQALKSWNISNRSQIHRATVYSISLHPGCTNAILGKASGTIPKKEHVKRVMSSIWKFSMQNTHPLDNFSIMRVKGEIFFSSQLYLHPCLHSTADGCVCSNLHPFTKTEWAWIFRKRIRANSINISAVSKFRIPSASWSSPALSKWNKECMLRDFIDCRSTCTTPSW